MLSNIFSVGKNMYLTIIAISIDGIFVKIVLSFLYDNPKGTGFLLLVSIVFLALMESKMDYF